MKLMKHKLATACFVIGAMAAPALVYAADSDSDRNKPATFVKDSAITTKIKAKLASENLDSLNTIRVDTDKDGVVWISGTAKNQDVANKAVMIARNTEGVRSVHNEIKVQK